MPSLEIIHVASEIAPFSKTGGLADMVGSLVRVLARLGIRVRTVSPKYASVSMEGLERLPETLTIPIGDRSVSASLWRCRESSGIEHFFLDIEEFFQRAGLYGEGIQGYPDNLARFTALSRGSLLLIKKLGLSPRILHVHDWQGSLIPIYLKTIYRDDPVFKNIHLILTIHNLGYQGIFPRDQFPVIGLPWDYCSIDWFEYYQKINLLKAGILHADRLTTVSPRYAEEIQRSPLGFGLEGILRSRASDLAGILNGIDSQEWNPETDVHLPAHYSSGNHEGKKICKRELQREVGLPVSNRTPVIGMVSRIVDQKGLDLVAGAVPELIQEEVQWILLGTGDPSIEKTWRELAGHYPEKVSVRIGYDPALAHRIEAGADFFIMASRYEPCGLNQLYSLHYGTLPIVRRVGGLADTIVDLDENPEEGTGIVFERPTGEDIHDAVLRALRLFRQDRLAPLRERIMKKDFSWNRPAGQYRDLYFDLLNQK